MRPSRFRIVVAAALAAAALLLAGCGGSSDDSGPTMPPGPVAFRVEIFLSGLEAPVTLAFAPDGRLFFNELGSGRIRVVEQGQLRAQPFAQLTVESTGERGLLGLAFHPQFASNRFLYALYSDPAGVHRVVRFTDSAGQGTDLAVIVDNLPSATAHNGGNIGFGPGGKLFVTVGDHRLPDSAQDPQSLDGKILRYNDDGSVPADNPFGASNPAFALGLRNSFDLTFHPQSGVIYASENGPTCDDEINRIVAGGNYGWRLAYQCGENDARFLQPIARFSPPIAPTGIAFYTGTVFPQFRGNLLMGSFNDGALRRFQVDDSQQGRVIASEIVVQEQGKILDVVEGPDGFIYFSTLDSIRRLVPQ